MIRRRELLQLAALGLLDLALPGCSSRRRSGGGGPYLQDVRTDRATVALVGERAERFQLTWAPLDGSAPARTVEDPQPVLVHGLQAVDLAPGTEYRYRLARGDQALGEGTFRSAAGPEASALSFVALGDSGGTDASRGEAIDAADRALERARGSADDENQQGRVGRAILAGSAPDLVLHTGDVVYPDGAAADYGQGFFQPFAGLISRVPVYPTLGNHDVKSGGGAPFLTNFFLPEGGPVADRRAYSFDWGPAHFVCLDCMTTPFHPGSEQLAWLEEDLGRSDRTWKVAFFHVPPYGPSRHGDNEPLQEALVPVLARGGVDLVLNGHDHVYARYFPVDGVTYVVTGGGGKNLYQVRADERLAYAESVFHYVEGTIAGRELRLRAVDASGRPFDAVTLRK